MTINGRGPATSPATGLTLKEFMAGQVVPVDVHKKGNSIKQSILFIFVKLNVALVDSFEATQVVLKPGGNPLFNNGFTPHLTEDNSSYTVTVVKKDTGTGKSLDA